MSARMSHWLGLQDRAIAVTGAASGIGRFDELLDKVRDKTPAQRLVGIEDVGRVAAFLAKRPANFTGR